MTVVVRPTRRGRRFAAGLLADRSGAALLEFGFSLPLLLGIGLYGVESANLALANLRVSQIALNLADNASRVGAQNSDNRQELREIDLNDVLTGTKLQGEAWELTKRGRITLTSLEEWDGRQWIHWQRCIGLKSGTKWDSSYGTTDKANGRSGKKKKSGKGPDDNDEDDFDFDGTEVPGGMGPAGSRVTAPDDSGVMFVEVNYQYKPVVSDKWLPGSTRIHYTASLIVRDRRVFERIYNPSPAATPKTCDLYSEA